MLPLNFFHTSCKSLRFALYLLLLDLLLTLAAYHLPLQFTLKEPATFSHSQSVLLFLGINTALEQSSPPARRAALVRLRADGFGWVRQRLDWGQMEPTPGTYDWRLSDALIHEIRAAGLVPVIVLDGSPAWARAPQDQPPTDNPFAPPANFEDFARFAAAFAARYRAQLDFYQIWDEPNIAPHWGNHLIEPVGYAQLLKVAAQAIRAVDPNATLISAALAPTRDRGHTAIDEVYYLQRLYAAGAAPYFDVLAIQPFGFGATPDDPRIDVDHLNFGRAQLLRQTMIAAGDGATPIWAVRYGWNRQLASPWATVSEANQIRFATDALTIANREWPWLTAVAWAIDQPDAPADDPIWGFALTPALEEAFRGWVQGAHRLMKGNKISRQTEAELVEAEVASANSGSAGDNRFQPVAARQNPLKRVGELFADWEIGWWLLLVAAGWRTMVVGGQLPWVSWGNAYRARAPWLRTSLWALLLLLYYFATWPGLILLYWLVAVILLRWQPAVGLWLAAALIPFYGQHKEFILGTLTFALAPSHAILLALALGMLWDAWLAFRGRTVRYQGKWRCYGASPERQLDDLSGQSIPQLTLPHLAVSWLLLNLLSAHNVWQWPAYWAGLWDLVLLPLLGFWLVRQLVHTQEQARHVALALFLGGVAVASVGLFGWWRGDGTAVDGLLRLVGPYFSPNQAALYLERTLLLGIGLGWITTAHRRWIAVACGLVMLALLLTASRGALFLALPFGGLLLAWGWWQVSVLSPTKWGRIRAVGKLSPRRRYLLFVAVAIMGVATVVLIRPLGERLTNSASVLQRLMIWRSTLALWHDFFWLGVGPDGFFWRYPAYLPLGALDEPNLFHPHNLWLELATGWGTLGLLWLGVLLWWLARQLCQLLWTQGPIDWLALALLASFGAGLAHAQVDAFLTLPDLALWNWLALALLAQLTNRGTRQNP